MKKVMCVLLSLIFTFSVFGVNASAATTQKGMNIYGIYLSREGDATLIESDGNWLLVDTGIEEASGELLKKLEFHKVRQLDILISHLHSDHIGGLKTIAESGIKIKKMYLPDASLTPYYSHTEYFIELLSQTAKSGNPDVVIEALKKGSTFSFGDVKAKVLGPVAKVTLDDFGGTETQPPEEQYVNCRSLTVRFDCGETSYLTAGDIENQEEFGLVRAYKGTGELDTDILKLSHHGLYTSNSEEFLAQVSPKYSFAQNSEKGINEGSNYRMYYTSCKNASKYGPVYLVGDEKADFKAEVFCDKISIFKGNERLSGLVTLAGGDGTVVKTYKYYITGGEVREGVYTIGGKKYYVSDGGFVNKAFYSFDSKKYVYRYEPVKNGNVRYFDLNGVLYTGFRKINGNYFYFNTTTGVLLKGNKNWTPVTIGSKKYAINENGAVYNYGKSSGAWKKYGSNYRYFDKNGVMKTGWLTVGSKKYYLNKTTGLRTVGLKKISGKYYYFVEKNNAGYVYKSGWKKFGSKYRYFDSKGVMKTGWLKVKGKYYYLDKKTGYRAVGLKKIGKKTYYFVEKNKKAYRYSGWKKFGSKKRYFDKKGVMVTGKKKINGKTYKFNKKGYLKK